MLKKLTSILLLLLILLPSVFADGLIIKPGGFIREQQQVAAINYHDGLQRMILAIKTDEIHDSKAAWIFPVPADPEDIVIDVVTQVPQFYGYDVKRMARNELQDVFEGLWMSQLYPLLFFFTRTLGVIQADSLKAVSEEALFIERGQSVIVHEHIEKEGMTTELVSAKDGMAVRLYLVNKGLDVPFNLNHILREYADQRYTFVISWITAQETVSGKVPNLVMESPNAIEEKAFVQLKATPDMMPREPYPYPYYGGRNLGIEIIFPTDRIYFPLLPTSVYGSEKVPLALYVLGYKKPILYDKIQSFVRITHSRTDNLPSYGELKSFYGNMPLQGTWYTLIQILDAPSKYFEHDMWIEDDTVPSDLSYALFLKNFIRDWQLLLTVLLLVLVSLWTGTILGLIFFGEEWWKYSLVGLANCFTILGVIIVMIFMKTRKIDEELRLKMKEAGVWTITTDMGKKLLFVVSFSVLFMFTSWLIWLLVHLPLK